MNFKEFKEKMENPRFKASVYLSGYLILGFIIILLARNRANNYEPVPPPPEMPNINSSVTDEQLLESFQNYAYEITLEHTVNNILNTYLIEGIRYKNEELFSYPIEEIIYYEKDNQYYQVVGQKITPVLEELFPIDLTKLKPENLSLMLNNLAHTLQTTIDGITMTTYYIPFEKFIYYYDGTEIIINPDKQINPLTLKFTISKINDIIQKIEFDLTNFVNQKQMTIEKLIYVCEFNNQGKIENFNVDFKQ